MTCNKGLSHQSPGFVHSARTCARSASFPVKAQKRFDKTSRFFHAPEPRTPP